MQPGQKTHGEVQLQRLPPNSLRAQEITTCTAEYITKDLRTFLWSKMKDLGEGKSITAILCCHLSTKKQRLESLSLEQAERITIHRWVDFASDSELNKKDLSVLLLKNCKKYRTLDLLL